MRSSYAKNNTDGGWFDDWIEGLIVINTWLLRIATDYSLCLVFGKGTIRMQLMLRNTFVSDNVGTRRATDEGPSVVVDQGLILVLHGMSPTRIRKGTTVCFWNGRNIGMGSMKVHALKGLHDHYLCWSKHVVWARHRVWNQSRIRCDCRGRNSGRNKRQRSYRRRHGRDHGSKCGRGSGCCRRYGRSQGRWRGYHRCYGRNQRRDRSMC